MSTVVDLIQATSFFWDSFMKQEFSVIEDLLSPDVRIQDQLKGDANGVSGEDCCLFSAGP
jgi:hypothetical protein